MTRGQEAVSPGSQHRALGVGPPAPDSHPFSLPPLQPAPRPVACEQRRPPSGRAGGPGGAVLPGGRRAPRAPRAPGLGRCCVGVPPVRRCARGPRRPRWPVRRLGPGPPHGLVDARVAAFHVNPRGPPGRGDTVGSAGSLGTRGGLTVPAFTREEGYMSCSGPSDPQRPFPAVPRGHPPAAGGATCGSDTGGLVHHVRSQTLGQGPGTPRSFVHSSQVARHIRIGRLRWAHGRGMRARSRVPSCCLRGVPRPLCCHPQLLFPFDSIARDNQQRAFLQNKGNMQNVVGLVVIHPPLLG